MNNLRGINKKLIDDLCGHGISPIGESTEW